MGLWRWLDELRRERRWKSSAFACLTFNPGNVFIVLKSKTSKWPRIDTVLRLLPDGASLAIRRASPTRTSTRSRLFGNTK